MVTLSIKFESELDEAHSSLTSARERYEAISETDTLPEPFIQGIRELEDQLSDFGRLTTVTQRELGLAQETRTRAELLEEALAAFQNRQELLVEQSVVRLKCWADRVAAVSVDHDPTINAISTVSQRVGILRQLIDAGHHAQVTTNSRVTPAEIECKLRDTDRDLREMLSPEAYVDCCTDVCGTLLDEIHELLNGQDPGHPNRTAFSSDLQTVKERRSAAGDGIENDDTDDAIESARTALEGALMVHAEFTRAAADQRLTAALGEHLLDHEFATPEAVEQLVAKGDVSTLLQRVTAALGAEVELSVEERVRYLLEESDGSVRTAVERAELDEATVLEHLTSMYTDKRISDIRVEFD